MLFGTGFRSKQRRFEKIVEPYRQKLYLGAYRLTGSVHDAEDLLQETFIRAFRNMEKLESVENKGGWLYTILKNLFLNSLDKQKRTPSSSADPSLVENLKAVEPVDGSIDDMDEKLQSALMELSESERVMLIAREVEGLSYQEIADMYGITLGTVKSRISRSRESLRAAYFRQNKKI
jgi:RNA polymerase sigma-70 factor (ECF subfamily)